MTEQKENSEKSNLIEFPAEARLQLPISNYGPICLKILHEFIEHHNLPKNLPLPEPSLKIDICLSRIFDILVHSMGKSKRKAILNDLHEYKKDIPACLKN